MDRREYNEDRLLAALMKGLLEEEGRELLAESRRLNADPAAAIPAELDKECRELIRAAFHREQEKTAVRMTWKVLKRVLIAAVLAALLFATACAAIPELRTWVVRFVWTSENNYQIRTDEPGAPPIVPSVPLVLKKGMPFEFTHIPEGFETFRKEVDDFGALGPGYFWWYVKGPGGDTNFYFEISPINGGTGGHIGGDIVNVTVRGFDGYMVQEIDNYSGLPYMKYVWFDLENGRMYVFSSLGLPYAEAQRIFDGIVIYTEAGEDRIPSPSNPPAVEDSVPFAFSYIPEGYELAKQETYEEGMLGPVYYSSYRWPGEGFNNFRFEIEPASRGTDISPDPDDSEVITNVKINGVDGYLIQGTRHLTGEEMVRYLWFDIEKGLRFSYKSIGIPFEESQRIFDGLVIERPG